MSLLTKLFHLLGQKQCYENAVWVGAELVCPVCDKRIAFRYCEQYEDRRDVRVAALAGFERYRCAIERREDTQNGSSDGDFVGTIRYTEFPRLLDHFQQSNGAVCAVSDTK